MSWASGKASDLVKTYLKSLQPTLLCVRLIPVMPTKKTAMYVCMANFLVLY